MWQGRFDLFVLTCWHINFEHSLKQGIFGIKHYSISQIFHKSANKLQWNFSNNNNTHVELFIFLNIFLKFLRIYYEVFISPFWFEIRIVWFYKLCWLHTCIFVKLSLFKKKFAIMLTTSVDSVLMKLYQFFCKKTSVAMSFAELRQILP